MDKRTASTVVINKILKSVVFAGMVGSAFVAPNLVQLGEVALKYLDKKSGGLTNGQTLYYMRRRGLIDYDLLPDGNFILSATELGKQRELRDRVKHLKINPPKQWDGKWRLVMFDIPENRRRARNLFSAKLRELHLYRLQKSVWVCPYACKEEIMLIRQAYGVPELSLVLAEVDSITGETELKKHFAL